MAPKSCEPNYTHDARDARRTSFTLAQCWPSNKWVGLVIKTRGQLITGIPPSSLSPASALVRDTLSSDSTGYSSETEDSGKLRPFMATFPATIKLQAV